MITELAPAKLNLALHVRARRADGYHALETLFAFVAFGDEIRIAQADENSLTITGPFGKGLSADGDNLVTRAAEAFRMQFGGGNHAITLEKRLPVASGIGGGSADAAATLRALGSMYGVGREALFGIAEQLGSDVPACLLGRTAIGRGRGELLEPVAGMPHTPVLLVNPGVAVSTAAVFAGWDGVDRGPLASDIHLSRNDLEPPARALAPQIDAVLDALTAQEGVTLARMSGSGATCFALFSDAATAEQAAEAIARPGWWVQQSMLTD